MGSPKLPSIDGARSFRHFVPLVLRSSQQVADEAERARQACTTLGFMVAAAFQRRRLGAPLTKLDERLISLAATLHSILPELWQAALDSDGAAPSRRLTLFTSS